MSRSPKGKQYSVQTTNKNIYGKKYSLCMSIDTSNIFSYILKEKSIKSDDFNNFITKDIETFFEIVFVFNPEKRASID